jgi:hypothetical protein
VTLFWLFPTGFASRENKIERFSLLLATCAYGWFTIIIVCVIDIADSTPIREKKVHLPE